MPVLTQLNRYTLDDLRALTLRKLRVRDTSRYSPNGNTDDYEWIDDALNRGQEEFVRRTLCLRTSAAIELKANTRIYRLPWNLLDFMTAYYYDSSLTNGYRELTVTTIERLNDTQSGWRTDTGPPEAIYVDRIYGNIWTFGVYPIPTDNGETITYDSEYGVITSWVCPLYTYSQEYAVVIRGNNLDEFLLYTDAGQIPDITTLNKNLWMEYYRLPERLVDVSTSLGVQGVTYPEIPKEYHMCLPQFAASDLLQDNPEDSVEMKRATANMNLFNSAIDGYIKKRKKPLSGIETRSIPMAWTYYGNMAHYKQVI